MSKLYESIDKLKNFTILKEDVVVKALDPMITYISLYYGLEQSMEIGLCEAIKAFNKFGNKGYLIANIEQFIKDEVFPNVINLRSSNKKTMCFFVFKTHCFFCLFKFVYNKVLQLVLQLKN